jgi:hypothetical protein
MRNRTTAQCDPPRSPSTARDFLVFTSAGEHANVGHWLRGGRNFDVWVAYYGPGASPFAGDVEIHTVRKGSKFQNLHFAYRQWPEVLARYRAVMVMDDDIAIGGDDISRLFELRDRLDLWVLQPAFHPKGKISHPITEVRPGLALRYTNFVEMTCPLFRRDKLCDFLDVYDPVLVGFGMDWWFLHTLGGPLEGRVAIVDEIACVNPRDRAKGGRREIDRLQAEPERRRAWQAIKATHGITADAAEQVEFGRVAKPLRERIPSVVRHYLSPYPVLRRLHVAVHPAVARLRTWRDAFRGA